MPMETVMGLHRRLAALPRRDPGRRAEVSRIAELFGVSASTVYRALASVHRPKDLRRADRGRPRATDAAQMNRYCTIVAALKVRTTNGQGRKLSTARAIELLEDYGVQTPEGLVQAPKGLLKRPTVDRWLQAWGYDHRRMLRAPAAVRFEARRSNECWQFDMSPSDLKRLPRPEWVEPGRGEPTLMLFSVVDDRSGVAYQEYRCVYGEDAESALRFLFNAMAPKEDSPFEGVPEMLYLDNGPVARSLVFQTVMERLGVDWRTHMPAGADGTRPTARSKGKVERPFRTVKEAHETLYHFHKPQTEAEANAWLSNFIVKYNEKPHRREPHSRIEDWVANLPESGFREMCSWERFCAFAREPERRTVGSDAHLSIQGARYEVDSELAGEEVVLWWGLFDQELFVEWRDKRFGPYRPSGGPIPLHRYRKRRKSAREKRAETVAALAAQLCIPRAAVSGHTALGPGADVVALPRSPFVDPDPWGELAYRGELEARRDIAGKLGKPLGALDADARTFIAALVQRTLDKAEIASAITERFLTRR
ncbi:MAG: IS481 family transposase [Chloroflexota bacterium]|nr:IS481 family transposase [Chloroflexota bacterium]